MRHYFCDGLPENDGELPSEVALVLADERAVCCRMKVLELQELCSENMSS